MTDSKSEPRQWAKHAAEKLAAKEWLAVYISGAGAAICILLTLVSGIVAGVAIWIAWDANQEAKVARLELQAYIREQSHVRQTMQISDRLQRGGDGSSDERTASDSDPQHPE